MNIYYFPFSKTDSLNILEIGSFTILYADRTNEEVFILNLWFLTLEI